MKLWVMGMTETANVNVKRGAGSCEDNAAEGENRSGESG
jgi:hypothetical protein